MAEAILYQMKATDENHGKIFQGLKDDLEIDLNDYDKVAEIGLSEFKKVFKNDIDGMLESIFSYGNTNKGFRQKNPNARSISVSDIIEIDGKYYYCDTFGFKEVTDKVKTKTEEAVQNYMDKLSTAYMAKIFTQMRQNGWDGSYETADQYFDEIMKKIDPDFEKNNPEYKEPEKEQAQDDTEPLREERYYYSEIVYVEDGLKSIKGSLGNVQVRLAEVMQDSDKYEYSKDQFEVLKNLDINIGNLIVDVAKVEEKLEKAFPSRIRMMTPEEKAYIEAHQDEIKKEESKEIKTENVMYWVETLGVNPYDVNYELNPKALEIIEKFKAAGKLDALFDYFSAGVVDPFENEEDYLKYVADTDISDFEIYNGKLDESEKLQEESDKENVSINEIEEDPHLNDDGSEKTIYDYLEDRIGEDISVGELNTFLQSLFGKFGETFLTFDEFYNQDPEDSQDLVIWDDEDMYTITYQIKDTVEPTIEITDIDVE